MSKTLLHRCSFHWATSSLHWAIWHAIWSLHWAISSLHRDIWSFHRAISSLHRDMLSLHRAMSSFLYWVVYLCFIRLIYWNTVEFNKYMHTYRESVFHPTHVKTHDLLQVINRRDQSCAAPSVQQCCQQGCSAMITMLLQPLLFHQCRTTLIKKLRLISAQLSPRKWPLAAGDRRLRPLRWFVYLLKWEANKRSYTQVRRLPKISRRATSHFVGNTQS